MVQSWSDSAQNCFQSRKAYRTRAVGMQICKVGVPIYFGGMISSLYWHLTWVAFGDFLGALGIIVCIVLNRNESHEFMPWPLYLSLWLSSFPALGVTGGLYSPFFPEHLGILFVSGVLIQNRFPLKKVATFILANIVFWSALTLFLPKFSQITLAQPFIVVRELLYLLALCVCVGVVALIDEKFDDEAAKQELQLQEAHGQLTHTVKLAEAGDLLATTAHELAQPVQVIAMSSALLIEVSNSENPNRETQNKLMIKINEASTRLARLLTQLRNFVRKEPFKVKLIDLREVVLSVQNITEHDLRTNNIQFEFNLPAEPVWINGDLSRIQQVLLNLINNARDASYSSQCPQVTVCLEKFLHFGRVCVKNNGPQIPLEIQKKLFQPYFTTKSRGKGTGLGLMISAEIVHQHQGRLFFASENDNTMFCTDFILASEEQEPSFEKNTA